MNRLECDFERLLRAAGYVETYDGQTTPQRQSDPTSLEPRDRRFFTRFYQQVHNNHFTGECCKLVYDIRTKRVECYIYKKAPNGLKITQQKLVTQGA